MNRRFFTALLATILMAPSISFAEQTLNYKPGLIEERLAAGETLLVDFAAAWCSTCKRQERVLAELRKKNPAFDEKLTFIKVDWDTYQDHAVASSRNIPRRSTLLVLRGDEELGRIVAGTGESEIEALLAKGL